MMKSKKASSAILSVFPNIETLHSFTEKSDNKICFESFVEFAFKEGVIKTSDENAFSRFIQNHSLADSDCKPPKNLTFEELFKKKKEILDISISERALTDRVNALILKKKLSLPKLTNTMLTRLKKEPADTPHKRSTLRSLVFWLGYERSDLDLPWNYEILFKLCYETNQIQRSLEGVRIGLTLSSRGDVIGQDAVAWLKKNIKDYIKNSMNILSYGGWGKVKSYDITTVYIDFPKAGHTNYPTSYQQSIRNAISVAHQIAVRWALSDFCTQNRFLSVGIATGEFANLNNYLLPILNAKLPGDPVIRMTDYTHQCILISDIRTVFCQQPKETTLFNGETLYIWWVVGLWSFVFWDFIPGLLEEKLMQPTRDSIKHLNQFFMYPDRIEDKVEPNAIKKFFLFPHNTLLGIEIAKTLYYRRCFWEANEILRIVLSIDPFNVCARSLRMILYRNIAIEEPSISLSEMHFKRAEAEAQFILKNCQTLEEDFYCEWAVVSLSRAICMLRRMREKQDFDNTGLDDAQLRAIIFAELEKANRLSEKGVVVSPTGYRSIYFMICAQVLKDILEHDEECFESPPKTINIPKRFYRKKNFEILALFNFFRWRDLDEVDYNLLEKILLQTFERHYGSATLDAYRPTLLFCFGVMLWDVFPKRTVSIVKATLNFFYDAIPIALELEKQNLYIYSYTRCTGEMQKPSEFIQHIKKAIHMVEACAGTMEQLENMDPAQEIEDNDRDFTLFTINI